MIKAKHKTSAALLFLLSFSFLHAQDTLKPDSNGIRLKNFYLSLNVENRWIAGHHINWETGLPDDSTATKEVKTHCSAFVASACEKKNIYILRPPQHVQGLLANAQFKWLKTDEAYKDGWRQITDRDEFGVYYRAQQYADKGYMVVAVLQNPDKTKPGHIALIMPDKSWMAKIIEQGPQDIQAGKHNYNSVALKEGFKSHITEWTEYGILFYYNVNSKL